MAVLADNYSYLVIDTLTNTAVAIDPCDPTLVMVCVYTFMSFSPSPPRAFTSRVVTVHSIVEQTVPWFMFQEVGVNVSS